VGGVVAGQHGDGGGHLPGLGGSAEGFAFGEAVEQFGGGDLVEEGVAGDARGYGVDADAEFGGFDGAAPGQGHHACLGGGVVGLAVLGAPAEDGGVVDDHAAVAGGAEVVQRGAGAAEGAVEGDVEDAVPLFVGHVDDRGFAAEARVVDHDVDAA